MRAQIQRSVVGLAPAVQQVQLVGVRIAQRPQIGGGGEQDVDRVDRQRVGHPTHRLDQTGLDVAAVGPDLGGDQCEHPLRIGLSGNEIGHSKFPQPIVEVIDLKNDCGLFTLSNYPKLADLKFNGFGQNHFLYCLIIMR